MFVQNIVDVAVSTMNVNIVHESSVYSGNVKAVPFYLLNQKVVSLSFSGTNIIIGI